MDTNREFWDERVPIHARSDFYDVAGVREGRNTLEPFEIEEMGDVTGMDLVHLQCHMGHDTISWARLGARVTGLDFSGPAIEQARAVAAAADIDATFVNANVYDAPAALGRTFDRVYVSHGALNWLPDIERWAAVVDEVLRPGGCLYLSEFHPFIDVFSDDDLTVQYPYFRGTGGPPLTWDTPGSYADREAVTEHDRTYEWNHPISDVVTAVVSRGLRLEFLHEHDYTLFARWPWLVPREGGTYRLPDDLPSLPFIYSFRATKPG